MIDLNSITGGIDGVLVGANAINDEGRIVGDYVNDPALAAARGAWP
jgi:hypothetical protein